MLSLLWLVFGSVLRIFRNRRDLIFENFVLRQQLVMLKRRRPRPALNLFDRISRLWSQWKQALIVVSPETVVRWHRAGFRMYWRLISRVRGPVGRRPTPKEVRELIFRMVAENPTWGAPRIHGELLMLGFDISKRTISRWMKRAPRDPEPGKRWLAFLRNHQKVMAAMDFFTVPTIRFGMLYCFFVIAHDRRRILEAFPFGSAPRFLIFDRDRKYGVEVPAAVRSLGIEAIQTSFESPWQKDYASHCTSWVRCDTTSLARCRCDSFMPWAFRGGLSPGCSYRQSFLSLRA